MAHGSFVWHDLMTTDLPASRAFYAALMGWTFDENSLHGGQYVLVHDGHHQTGGLMAMEPGLDMPSHWMPYMGVDDLDAAVARAQAGGGKLHHGPFPVQGVGRMAVLADPFGAPFNVIQEDTPTPLPEGRPMAGQFCWYSLSVPDAEAAAAFYAALFGWSLAQVDIGGGAVVPTFMHHGQPVAGVSPPQGPMAHWALSVVVPGGVDAAWARVPSLGGRGLMPPMAVGGMGRMCVIQGPSGEGLGLFEAT